MRKHSTVRKSAVVRKKTKQELTVGVDLGDRSSRYCILDEQGELLAEGSVATTRKGFAQVFGSKPRSRVVLEVGTHSPWVSRNLAELGHEVIVANPRRVRLITDSSRKDDRLDARTLARLARIDPELLSPIRHRSQQSQADLMVIRARALLVEARTMIVNAVRGLTKSYGERLPSCGTGRVREELAGSLSEPLQNALKPLLAEVESVSERIAGIRRADREHSDESIPGDRVAEAGARGGSTNRTDICADGGGPASIPSEPGCRRLLRITAPPTGLWRQSAATTDHKGRGCVRAEAAGAVRASHSGSFWSGQQSTTLGIGTGRTRW